MSWFHLALAKKHLQNDLTSLNVVLKLFESHPISLRNNFKWTFLVLLESSCQLRQRLLRPVETLCCFL